MSSYIDNIIELLSIFAYTSICGAVATDCINFRNDGRWAMRLLYMTLLIAGIKYYPNILAAGMEIFDSSKGEARDKFITSLVKAKQDNPTSGFSLDLAEQLKIFLFEVLWLLCDLLVFFSSLIRSCFVTLYKVCCPVVLGLAAWKCFQPLAVKFAIGTLWLCMWMIGTAIADLMILEIFSLVFAEAAVGAAAATAAGVAGGPALIFALLAIVIGMFFAYIIIPIALYSILSTGDIGQSALHAGQGIMRTPQAVSATSSAMRSPTGQSPLKSSSSNCRPQAQSQLSSNNTSSNVTRNLMQ